MSYHLSHNSTIRFEKFRHIHENILRIPYTQEIEETLGQRFSEITLSKIVACPIVAGAYVFLDDFSRRIPLFLASISPPADLDRILEQRHLRKYFKRIYAYPWQKPAVIRDVMSRGKVSPTELVFIGDSPEDLEAARGAGIPFIGRQSGKWADGIDAPLFNDFIGIRSLLIQHNI
jgi:phosphoglycolate phosphatase-like HAD superfamily hydrolase